MPTPSSRVPLRIGRGDIADLNTAAGSSNIAEGEILYARDEDQLYVYDSATMVTVSADISKRSIGDLSNVDAGTPTDGDALVYNAGTWGFAQSFIGSVVEDTTPELGGNLAVTGFGLVTAGNNNINLTPDGNGNVKIVGNATGGAGRLSLTDENGSNYITLKGPANAALANYTLTLPDDMGASGQVLVTDGTSTTSWGTYVSLATLKTETAAATDFADFQARIAAL